MLHSTWRCGGRGRGKRTSRSSTAASTTPARSAASTPAIGAAAVVVASWRPSRRLPSAAATDTDADADAGALTARYKARQGDGADINNGRPSVVRFRSNLSEALVIMTHFRLLSKTTWHSWQGFLLLSRPPPYCQPNRGSPRALHDECGCVSLGRAA